VSDPDAVTGAGALRDLTVVDLSTLFAGPMAAMHLGDMGARVIKVEHPRRPDPSRGHGPSKDGQNLWWKTLGRNKRTVAIDLHTQLGGVQAQIRIQIDQAGIIAQCVDIHVYELIQLGI